MHEVSNMVCMPN